MSTMPYISAQDARTFTLQGVTFTALAAPSRGARENAVWVVTVPPGTPPHPHRLTREETFVVLEGEARARVDGREHRLVPGSALVVPRDTDFALDNPFEAPFRAVVVLPVGGQAVMEAAEPFTPPWAE